MKFSAVVARRGVRASPSNCRASTPAPDDHSGAEGVAPPARGFGFPRRNRLTRGADIKAVGQEGKRIRTEHLEIRVVASPLTYPRVGVVVPRHRHSAVDRNRLKRRLREIVRVGLIPPLSESGRGADVVIRTRESAYTAAFAALQVELSGVVARVIRLVEPAAESAT